MQDLITNYNNTKHGTTGQPPVRIHVDGNAAAIKNAAAEIEARAEKRLAENTHNFPELRMGDKVRIARRTFSSFRKSRTFKKFAYMKNWSYELFKVASITRSTPTKASLYTLLDPEGKLVDHQFLRQDLLLVDEKSLLKELERGEYVVEQVLDKKMVNGKPKYLVRWYGYGPDEDTWQSPEPSFQSLIDKYEAEHTEDRPEALRSRQRHRRPVVENEQQLNEITTASTQRANTVRTTRSRAKKQ